MKNPGRVIGVAGGGLANASWAANEQVAKQGEVGEKATARILDPLALLPGGFTVIHDVRIPIPNFTANIDHIVVSGSTVCIIDAKSWKPGVYLRAPAFLGGHVYRDRKRFAPGEKKTMAMAHEAMARYLGQHGVTGVKFATPVVVVWPTSSRKPLRMFFSMTGATMVTSTAFGKRARKHRKPARPDIVAAIMPLVNNLQRSDHTMASSSAVASPAFGVDEFGVAPSERTFPTSPGQGVHFGTDPFEGDPFGRGN